MELHFIGKNMEISPAARAYVQRKLNSLSRHFPNFFQGEVKITREMTKAPEHRYVVQVTLNHGGTILRGEERAIHLYAAIDKVAEVMKRQVDRYKGKLYHRGYNKARGISLGRSENVPVEETQPEPTRKVVKVKRFEVKPMSLEEATEQMELLGHDFFIFLDDATAKFSLLYRRRDGDYGLIQPELA
jgi:putative sigma-54 modulation protein